MNDKPSAPPALPMSAEQPASASAPPLPTALSSPPMGPRLENRLPAEGINSSHEHPLKEFAWLVVAAVVTVAAVAFVVGWGAQWLAPRLPFSVERAVAERLMPVADPRHAARDAALRALGERVAAAMGLPEGMALDIRFEDHPLPNAYATVGGHVRIFRGLLEALQHEDELAALLAHEIAHVKHRHVAANMGRELSLAVLLGMLSADAGAAMASATLGQGSALLSLHHSRQQETQADADALRATVALYGHAGGVQRLFERLGQLGGDGAPALKLLRTHPLTVARQAAVRAQAQQAGWALEGPAPALPEALRLPRPANKHAPAVPAHAPAAGG